MLKSPPLVQPLIQPVAADVGLLAPPVEAALQSWPKWPPMLPPPPVRPLAQPVAADVSWAAPPDEAAPRRPKQPQAPPRAGLILMARSRSIALAALESARSVVPVMEKVGAVPKPSKASKPGQSTGSVVIVGSVSVTKQVGAAPSKSKKPGQSTRSEAAGHGHGHGHGDEGMGTSEAAGHGHGPGHGTTGDEASWSPYPKFFADADGEWVRRPPFAGWIWQKGTGKGTGMATTQAAGKPQPYTCIKHRPVCFALLGKLCFST